MWKRNFSVKNVSRISDSVLSKYYPPNLIQSIRLAQSVIPENTKFRKSNIDFASNSYRDNFSQLHPFWDYNPNIPNEHQSSTVSTNKSNEKIYNPFNINQQMIPSNTYPDEVKALATQSRISKNLILANGIYKQTKIDPSYIMKTLKMRPLVLKRVSNQTGKGKIASFYALVIVGDKNGMIGLGEGKSRSDMAKAVNKAHWDAIRNIQFVPRFENRTIFSDIDYRYHGVKLFLRKKEPGFGLRVNHIIFEICQILGIKDLSGKVYKSRNHMNIAKGVIEALTQGQKSINEIALGRGKKIVDVRKVYYSE